MYRILCIFFFYLSPLCIFFSRDFFFVICDQDHGRSPHGGSVWELASLRRDAGGGLPEKDCRRLGRPAAMGVPAPLSREPELGSSRPRAGVASQARALAARAQGAAAMASTAPHLLLYREDEDIPLELSSFEPWQAHYFGPTIFSEKSIFLKIGIFLKLF